MAAAKITSRHSIGSLFLAVKSRQEAIVHDRARSPQRGWARTAGGIALFVAFIALTFVLAGRVDWIQAWIFYAVYLLYVLAWAWRLSRLNPGLYRERRQAGEKAEGWDKAIMAVYGWLLAALVVVAALDAGRFRWSPAPLAAQVGAWGGLTLGGAVIWHVMTVNAYLSSVARVQEERGQTVIDRGLYAHVRHPMYAAIVVMVPCVALALGSLWALVPAVLIDALFVLRTAREDRMLQDKLPGYAEYARRVRYRLVPGVW
jgi:protein-S-isoprenylcysteine O-methyltransferase Ste14